MNSPWNNALSGAEMPGLRLASPPTIYTTAPADNPEYDWCDQEVVLGIWLDGEMALCKYDEKTDRCLSPDGTYDFHATGQGQPYWFIPLKKKEQ